MRKKGRSLCSPCPCEEKPRSHPPPPADDTVVNVQGALYAAVRVRGVKVNRDWLPGYAPGVQRLRFILTAEITSAPAGYAAHTDTERRKRPHGREPLAVPRTKRVRFTKARSSSSAPEFSRRPRAAPWNSCPPAFAAPRPGRCCRP